MASTVAVIGGGLAGSEAAGVLSRGGLKVTLFEQKPVKFSPAHKSGMLGELVCSNSLKSDRTDRPQGWLKAEMRAMGSLVMRAAEACSIPGGEALVVDRERFAAALTGLVSALDGVEIIRYEAEDIRELLSAFDSVLVASGPLTSDGLAASLASIIGEEGLHFYDAISPIVSASSIDETEAFRASRYGRGGDDYINCPISREIYAEIRKAIIEAGKVEPRSFEEARYFEACLPIETIASRGELAMAYGPLSPAGLADPRTGKRPYSNLQLRMENAGGTAFSLVAFQTRMKYGEQERIIRMIPALKNAEFLRYGSIHRNTFLDAPRHLKEDLSFRSMPGLYAAGVLTGVEGYCESAVSGLLSGMFILARAKGVDLPQPPPASCTGALHMHVKGALSGPGRSRRYQPMNMNRGILPELTRNVPKQQSFQALYERAMSDLATWLDEVRRLGLGI